MQHKININWKMNVSLKDLKNKIKSFNIFLIRVHRGKEKRI